MQGSLDAWCTLHCKPTHCDGPVGKLVARRSGPGNEFRCYSERSLKSDKRTWSGQDHCYCSRDSTLKDIIQENMYATRDSKLKKDKCKAMMSSWCMQECQPRISEKCPGLT